MNILLLGATGRVGGYVIDYALAAKHQVLAVVRNPAKIQRMDAGLTIVEGDLSSLQGVLERGQFPIDMAINVIGGDVLKPSTIVTESVRAALAAMKQQGIVRYLGISGIAEMASCRFFGTISVALLRRSPIRYAIQDHDAAIALVKASETDWTLAGCPYIRDGQHTANYKIVPECFPGGFKTISPQDVADFLVKEATNQHYSKQVVGIWN